MSPDPFLLLHEELSLSNPKDVLHHHFMFEAGELVEVVVPDEIEELRSEVELLREQLMTAPLPIKVTKVREISPEDAMPLVLSYLKERGTAYPSDIAEALDLDMDTTLAVIDTLTKQGKLK